MTFIDICKKTQLKLKESLIEVLTENGYEPISQDGFIYAAGNIPVMLLAHMDTVHKDNCTIVCCSENGYVMSPQGIGGDDRCGIFMILEIIKDMKCHVLFTEDEEKGCIGANKFVKADIKPEVNYLIEFDRKGKDDAVFYRCDNKDFEEFITNKEIGFKTASGSCSDISYVAPHLGVAAVNLSCGYYNAHTLHEYVNIKQMINNIERAKKLIAIESDKFEYVEKVYTYKNFSYKSYYDGVRYYDDYSGGTYSSYLSERESKGITVYSSENNYNSVTDVESIDDYSAAYDKMETTVYNEIDVYAIMLFEEHSGIEVDYESFIPVESLVDYKDSEFTVDMSGIGRISLEQYLIESENPNFCYDASDLYIDKYCNIYKRVSDAYYGIYVMVKTDDILTSDRHIKYYEEFLEEYPVMNDITYTLFEDYIVDGVIDNDIEDYVTDTLLVIDT